MSRARTLVGAVGLLGAAIALGLVVAPESLGSVRPVAVLADALPADKPELLLLGLGAVVGLGASTIAYSVGGDGRAGPLVDQPPETVNAQTPSRPGRVFDRQLAGQSESNTDVREPLRTAAIETLVRHRGVDPADAREAIGRGTWTDDQVAAAFLGRPNQSLPARLRHWLDPDGERQRRVNRTVAAIERVQQ